MSDYSKTVNFAAKDSLSTGDSNKIVRGTEINTEFDNIATAIATKLDSSGAVFTNPVSYPDGSASSPAITNTGDTNCGLFFSAADTLAFTAGGTAQFTMADGVIAPVTDNDVDLGTSSLQFKDAYINGTANIDSLTLTSGATVTIIADEDNMSSNSATSLATQQSIKAYVDSEVSGSGSMSNWVLEDGDGTEVTISNAKEVKFVEGGGIDIDWTDTDNGTDGDPYDLTFTINAAQTSITSIYATDLILGEDAETAIDFGTTNEIDFKVDNAARLTLTSSALYPVTNNQIDLGTSSLEFKDAYFDGTVTSDAFAGPLTGNVTGNVSGTAATVTGAAQSNITSLGTLTTLTVDNIIINGTTIGHTDDTDLVTLADGIATVAGELSVTTLDIGGTNVTSTAAELNLLDGASTLKQVGKETIYVPAAAMYPNTTAGSSDLTQVELSNGPELKCLDFDASSDENAQFTVAFPKSWNEGTVTFQVFFTVTGTNTGTVAWGLSGGSMADNAQINTAFGTNVVATAKAHSGTSNDIDVTAESGAVTIANAAADTLTFFQIMRDVSADNQSGDARLLGIKLFFTTDAANDA
jgi:hypothetical protein